MSEKRSLSEYLALFIMFVCIATPIGLLVYNCKDYSNTLEGIGLPMQEKVLAFYKKNQRYPNLKESTILIEEAGCINNKQQDHREKKRKKVMFMKDGHLIIAIMVLPK